MTSEKPRQKSVVQLLLSDMLAQTSCQRQRIADESDQTTLPLECSNPTDNVERCSSSDMLHIFAIVSAKSAQYESTPRWQHIITNQSPDGSKQLNIMNESPDGSTMNQSPESSTDGSMVFSLRVNGRPENLYLLGAPTTTFVVIQTFRLFCRMKANTL